MRQLPLNDRYAILSGLLSLGYSHARLSTRKASAARTRSLITSLRCTSFLRPAPASSNSSLRHAFRASVAARRSRTRAGVYVATTCAPVRSIGFGYHGRRSVITRSADLAVRGEG